MSPGDRLESRPGQTSKASKERVRSLKTAHSVDRVSQSPS
jgi:hypothetical protein